MQENNLYPLFHILSRAIIIFAIMVFVIGLIVRFNQNQPKIQSNVANQKPTVITPTRVTNTQLNLQGPFICNFFSKEATVSGYIKDMNAFGQIKERLKTTNVLLNNDCIYVWMEKSFEGQRFCGLKPYITMIGNNSGLLNNFLSNPSLSPIKKIDIRSIANSCKKEKIQNEQIFDLPKNVIFKNKEIPRL